MAEFFLSYTSSNRDWAEWIGQCLQDLGHKPRLHDWEIAAGGDILLWMQERLQAADHVLCVVSAAYQRASFASWEMRSAAWASHSGRPNLMLPVLIEPCELIAMFATAKRCHLFGLTVDEARARLKAYLTEPSPPANRVAFPGVPSAAALNHTGNVLFPGSASPAPALAPAPLPWPNAIMGRDSFGPHASFQVPGTNLVQRLRWCPPGRFLMGSPESEEGRYGDEGPQHEVVFAAGFWLFDTPCTQVLWQAVTGQNPSKFKGDPTLPVETVRFTDATGFISRLNSLVPGLTLTLPSEAQWEYACRAGTTTPRYGALDDIAWYDSNSAGRTQPVGRKQPNAWGLHDMLGNVLEWCEDRWHDSYEDAPRDGSAWLARAGAEGRVVRGGSWIFEARDLRAAYRFGTVPDDRFDNQGFRCARVQHPAW